MTKKPMLAGTIEDVNTLKFPVLASPKLDGIRCLTQDGAVSRKLLPIPNKCIRNKLSHLPQGLDGELMAYNSDGSSRTFNQVQGDVMRESGEPIFKYIVFDIMISMPYIDRIKVLEKLLKSDKYAEVIKSRLITSLGELLKYEKECLTKGYEGVMVRSLNSPYKHGRSTLKEGYLLKLKRFKDAEARIIGFEARQHNSNEAGKDNLGNTKRSSKKSGMVQLNTLGALQVILEGTDLEFNIGTGFNGALRQHIWDNRYDYLDKLVKFKYQELSKDGIPRFPVFLGFRSEIDT